MMVSLPFPSDFLMRPARDRSRGRFDREELAVDKVLLSVRAARSSFTAAG